MVEWQKYYKQLVSQQDDGQPIRYSIYIITIFAVVTEIFGDSLMPHCQTCKYRR